MTIKILAIETSCDDTCVALLHDLKIIWNKKITHNHTKTYQGVVPELSANEHLFNLQNIFEKINYEDFDYIAVTVGPGLISSLNVGYFWALTISELYNKIFIPVHHLEGHIFAVSLSQEIKYPSVALLVSGGHSQIYYLKSFGNYELLIDSLDDSAGEVLDKVAKKYNLGFPGGPIIEKLAQKSTKESTLIPMRDKPFFSFSGLKTRYLNLSWPLEDICSSLEKTLGETFKNKLDLISKPYENLLFVGGVSANIYLNKLLQNYKLLNVDIQFSSDNAAMIGASSFFHILHKTNKINNKDILPFARLSLDLW